MSGNISHSLMNSSTGEDGHGMTSTGPGASVKNYLKTDSHCASSWWENITTSGLALWKLSPIWNGCRIPHGVDGVK